MDSCDVMSVCEISSWDDWTILELMDRIPLGELLLRLGQASRRFNQLAKKNCQGRRKLLLYIPSANGNRMRFVDQFNGISLQKKLDGGTVERILDLLPGITWAEIYSNSESSETIDGLVYLLEGWVDQLATLKIKMPNAVEPHLHTFPLLGLVNRMRRLKIFEFRYYSQIAETDWAALHLPVISQLEQFKFSTIKDAAPVVRQLLTYGTPSLAHIELGSIFDEEMVRQLLEFPPYLAKSVKLLMLGPQNFDFDLLLAVCEMYTSLELIDMSLDLLTIGQLNRALAKLPRLTCLCLTAYFSGRNARRRVAEEAAALLGEPFEPDPVDSSQLVPLLGVTRLLLRPIMDSHRDWDMLHLDKLFPNLEILIFLCCGNICKACAQNVPHEDDMNMKRYYFPEFQSKATFGELFPKLRKLVIGGHSIPEEDWKQKHVDASEEQPKPLKKYRSIVGRMVRFISKRLRTIAQKAISLVRPAEE